MAEVLEKSFEFLTFRMRNQNSESLTNLPKVIWLAYRPDLGLELISPDSQSTFHLLCFLIKLLLSWVEEYTLSIILIWPKFLSITVFAKNSCGPWRDLFDDSLCTGCADHRRHIYVILLNTSDTSKRLHQNMLREILPMTMILSSFAIVSIEI